MTDIFSHSSVSLSYDPQELRFGYSNDAQYFLERRRNRTLLQGSLRIHQLQVQYNNSYLQTDPFTLLGFRDLLISLALAGCIRCIQTRDVSFTSLTPHARRYWSRRGNSFWPSIPLFEDEPDYTVDKGLFGLAGTLAFWMYKNQDADDLYPTQLIRRILTHFWWEYGEVLEDQPVSELQALALAGFQIDWAKYQTALTKLQTTAIADQPEGAIAPLRVLRGSLLTENDWTNLKQRFLLGEYTDDLIKVLVSLESFAATPDLRQFYGLPEEPTDFIDLEEAVLSAAEPGGLPLVYQALSVQGLLNAIEVINSLEEGVQQVDFASFLNQLSYESIRVEIAQHLATSYDANGALGLFNTLLEARGLAYRYYLTALQLIKHNDVRVIPQVAPYRLNDFIN